MKFDLLLVGIISIGLILIAFEFPSGPTENFATFKSILEARKLRTMGQIPEVSKQIINIDTGKINASVNFSATNNKLSVGSWLTRNLQSASIGNQLPFKNY
jgi:hypothetical protein